MEPTIVYLNTIVSEQGVVIGVLCPCVASLMIYSR